MLKKIKNVKKLKNNAQICILIFEIYVSFSTISYIFYLQVETLSSDSPIMDGNFHFLSVGKFYHCF